MDGCSTRTIRYSAPSMSETAIAIAVPEADPLVDLLRREHTRDGGDGMPAHITLLYPFTETDTLVARRLGRVREVLAAFAACEIEFAETRRFALKPEAVLWLAPSPSEQLVAMIDALATEFPEHPPFGGRFDSIVPHLTLAVTADSGVLDRIESEVTRALPIRARIVQAALYEHAATGWRERSRFELGPFS